jgi:hypothetical protein
MLVIEDWAPSWELWLLLMLLVTVFGLAVHGPNRTSLTLFGNDETAWSQRIEGDPYGVGMTSEPIAEENRGHLETGY